MKTLEIRDVARDLERAAEYYMENAVRDRIGGALREWFDAALHHRGMGDVVEIAEPTAVFVDANLGGSGTIITTIGSTEYAINRVVTPKYLADVDEIRADASKFLHEVRTAIDKYAQTLAPGTAVATVPALYVRVFAYAAEWSLWGYAGTPNDTAQLRSEAE